MSLRPDVAGSGDVFSSPHDPVVLEPYEDADADPVEAYDLDLWDQMSDDMRQWNRDFSYDRRHPVGNSGAMQLLAVAYGEKPGHDLGDGLGSAEAVEEAIDYARDLGLTVVYRWEGIDEELAEDSHEIYVTNDEDLADLAAEQDFSFYRDDDVYGQLMGFPEEDIESYRDWSDKGRDFEPSGQRSMRENMDAKKEYVRSRGGKDSVVSHRAVVREMMKGKEYDYGDFLGAFTAFDNRIVDEEGRIQEVVDSARRLDRKLKEDTSRGIVEFEDSRANRQIFDDHRKHYRGKTGNNKGLSDFLPGFIG